MRRLGAGALRRKGFRGIGKPYGATETGLRFTSGQYAIGTGGDYAEAYRWFRVICAPNTAAPQAFRYIAGLDGGGGGSILLGCESNAAHTFYTMGKITAFDGLYSEPVGPEHIMWPNEIGRYQVHDVVIDGTSMLHYCNGRLVRIGTADVKTTWSSANPLAINSRPTAAGTLQFGDVTVFEVQLSTTVPTAAQVRAAAIAPVGTAIAGCTRQFVAADRVGASWPGRIGGKSLTVTGSPTMSTISAAPKALGAVYVRGDSHVAREPGPVEADGYRRRMLQVIGNERGAFVSAHGQNTFTASTTPDFDPRNGGIAGQALGVANGPVAALSTLASDLSSYCTRDGALVLEFGTNDTTARAALGETASQIRTHFLADCDSALTIAGAYMDAGRPIVFTNTLKQGTGGGGVTSVSQAAVDLINADFPAWIAARVGTYPGLRLADWNSAITQTQAAADDTGVLFDKIHMAAAYRAIAGETIANVLAGFL